MEKIQELFDLISPFSPFGSSVYSLNDEGFELPFPPKRQIINPLSIRTPDQIILLPENVDLFSLCAQSGSLGGVQIAHLVSSNAVICDSDVMVESFDPFILVDNRQLSMAHLEIMELVRVNWSFLEGKESPAAKKSLQILRTFEAAIHFKAKNTLLRDSGYFQNVSEMTRNQFVESRLERNNLLKVLLEAARPNFELVDTDEINSMYSNILDEVLG